MSNIHHKPYGGVCNIDDFSSRICERGTLGCTVQHKEPATKDDGPLTTSQVSSIKRHVPQGTKMEVLSSIFAPDAKARGIEPDDDGRQIAYLRARIQYWESHFLAMYREQGIESVITVCASLLANKDAASRGGAA